MIFCGSVIGASSSTAASSGPRRRPRRRRRRRRATPIRARRAGRPAAAAGRRRAWGPAAAERVPEVDDRLAADGAGADSAIAAVADELHADDPTGVSPRCRAAARFGPLKDSRAIIARPGPPPGPEESLPGGVAQLVRAPACHAGGRGFESRRSRSYTPLTRPLADERHVLQLETTVNQRPSCSTRASPSSSTSSAAVKARL